MIPEPIIKAFRALKASVRIQITSELELPPGKDYVRFTCDLPVPSPNSEGLPSSLPFEVRTPLCYPFAKVEFVPLSPELHGFPHQACLGGALCLLPSQSAYPWSDTERLRGYVESAIQWVADAAHGHLLDKDQPWELPDFRTGFESLAPPLLFVESSDSYAQWSKRVGQFGIAQLARHCTTNGIVVVRFQHEGVHVQIPPIAKAFYDCERLSPCEWILVSSLVYLRHRPPLKFSELDELCRRDSIDFWQILRRAVRHPAFDNCHHILIGTPIPRIVGSPFAEIHWQPITIPKSILDRMPRVSKGHRNNDIEMRSRLQTFLKDMAVPWTKSVNMAPERLLARGAMSDGIRAKRICLLGCGAIGSLVAEYLARGGVNDLTLVDSDLLEFENLVRHPLAPFDVGEYKAKALVRRHKGLSPSTIVTGYSASVPISQASSEYAPLREKLGLADVIIDCTADDSAFRWASHYGRIEGKTVIHIYTNPHARMLTLCCSGRHASCQRVASRLDEDVESGITPFSKEQYYPVEEIEPGAGCWKATFPARGSDLATLVGAAMPVLERFLGTDRGSKGTAVVLRRNELSSTVSQQPLVEIVWAQDYR